MPSIQDFITNTIVPWKNCVWPAGNMFLWSVLLMFQNRQKLGNSSENVECEISQNQIPIFRIVYASHICLSTQKKVVIVASYYQSLETWKNNLCLIKPKEIASEKTASGSSPCPAKFISRLHSRQWCNIPLPSALTDLF